MAQKIEEKINNKTVELKTIEEEKAVNYKRNKIIVIIFSTLSVLLLGYIIYLCLCAFGIIG